MHVDFANTRARAIFFTVIPNYFPGICRGYRDHRHLMLNCEAEWAAFKLLQPGRVIIRDTPFRKHQHTDAAAKLFTGSTKSAKGGHLTGTVDRQVDGPEVNAGN